MACQEPTTEIGAVPVPSGRLDLKLKLWFEYELLLLFSGLCWAARCSAVPTGIPCQVTAATSGSIVPEQADALSVQVASYYSSAV